MAQGASVVSVASGAEAARELLWVGYTRVYFNAWEDAPRFWSLDQGAGTVEVTVEGVKIEGGALTTVVKAASKVQPRAWMEGVVAVSRDGDGGMVVEAVEL